MQSYRTNSGWISIFDCIDETPDPSLPRPDIFFLPILLSITCYVNYQYIPSERTETIKITEKGFYYNYIYKEEAKTYTFDYYTSWLLDISEENEENSNFKYAGALRLSKRDHVCDLIFQEKDSYYQAKAIQEHYTIRLDFEDRYIVKEKIGHGASANVFKIQDTAYNNKYAGKQIGKDYLKKTSKRVISVTKEIAILRLQDHPNVVKQVEVHETEDYVIQIMELLEGEPLQPDLFKYSKTRATDVKSTFSQIISAIKYMNGFGLMHRDIKPNNIRFEYKYNGDIKNTIKLIDFGFAEYYTNEKFTRYYCGTVGYMCPFQMNMNKNNPKNYGPEVDFYSIGVLLYFVQTGEKVFMGKNHEEKRKLNKQNAVPWNKIKEAKISEKTKDLIFKQLNANPVERIKMCEIEVHPYFSSDYPLGNYIN